MTLSFEAWDTHVIEGRGIGHLPQHTRVRAISTTFFKNNCFIVSGKSRKGPGNGPRRTAKAAKAGFQQGGWGVNSAPQNWGGGFGKKAQLTGPFITHYEV